LSKNIKANKYNNEYGLFCETSRKFFIPQFPQDLTQKEILEFLKNKNPRNSQQSEAGIQVDSNEKNLQSNNIKLLKKLIDNSIVNNNLEDINYVLESPYRGVEKLGVTQNKTCSKEKDETFYLPIYIGNNSNNSRGNYFRTNVCKSKSKSMPKINNLKSRRNIIYQYNNEFKRNKDFDSPLKELSKISGVTCCQLRKVIDYSLKHRINNFNFFMKNQFRNEANRKILSRYMRENHSVILNNNSNNNSINNNNISNNNQNKDKGIYSVIILKSKQRKNNSESHNKKYCNPERDISFEDVVGKNSFQDKYYNNRGHTTKINFPIRSIKDNNPFNNLTIKDKIGALNK
jgi:hypothetical protein